MTDAKKRLAGTGTYVFIDASNIRTSCFKTLGLRLDFVKLLDYFRKKYPALREVRYYEGISANDEYKQRAFTGLTEVGYKVCALERKTYIEPPRFRKIKCKNCGNIQDEQILGRSTKMKSNVDVYLATELLEVAYLAREPIHIILVSCDGDYAEMIRNVITKNDNVSISVLATPAVKDFARNTLSVRLKELRGKLPRYHLIDIRDIAGLVAVEEKK